MDLITFNCSSCQQVLKVSADNAGKQAKCPRCGAAMIIPAASAGQGPPVAEALDNPYEGPRSPRGGSRYPEEEFSDRPARSRRRDEYDDDYDRPSRSRRRDTDYDEDRGRRGRPDRYEDDYDRPARGGMSLTKKWGFVSLGLLLVAISACVIAGYAAMQSVTDVLRLVASFRTGGGGEGTAFKVIGRIGHGLAFAGGITALVGYVFCIFVPNKQGTLVLAIIALSVGGVNLIFNLLCKLIPMFKPEGVFALLMPGFGMVTFNPFDGSGIGGAFALSIFVILFYYSEFIIFPLFLWAMGHAVRARRLAGTAMGIVIFASIVAGIQLLGLILTFVFFSSSTHPKGLAIVSSIIQLLADLGFLGMLIWYILVLFQSRNYAAESR